MTPRHADDDLTPRHADDDLTPRHADDDLTPRHADDDLTPETAGGAAPVALRAADVMTASVATVTETTSIGAAIRLMLEKRVSGLPVLDSSGVVVGILTEGDLLRRVELGTAVHRARWLEFILGPSRLADEYVETHSRVVGDIMTSSVLSVDATASLSEVVALMQGKRIKQVPVLATGRLMGIVRRSDLLRALADVFASSVACDRGIPAPDASLRETVLAELGRQPWAQSCELRITVVDGAVELEGVLFDEAVRAAIRVVAENVPGVKSVHDHLVWVEPNSGFTYTP